MTQEDKELLLKDLCARLSYGLKLQKTYDTNESIELCSIDLDHHTIKFYKYKGECLTICDTGNIERFGILRFKPYLFPLSSMTEEQRKELDDTLVELNLKALSDEINSEVIATYEIDFYNKNHFDYRGLIPKGLAIDATGLNIY